MIYLAYFILASGNIECPNWLPGTNEVLPPQVTLRREDRVRNLLRCYCEVVKVEEKRCIQKGTSPEACKEKTLSWYRDVFVPSATTLLGNGLVPPVPNRMRMMTIEP